MNPDYLSALDKIAKLERENRELRSRLEPKRQKVYVLVYRSRLLKGQIRAMAFESDMAATHNARDFQLKPNEYIIIHTSL